MPNANQVSWDSIHERMLLNSDLPPNCFSVFHAIQPLLIKLKYAGLNVGPQTLPDISVGQRWGSWWVGKELSRKYGGRAPFPHYFPAGHPQANADVDAWIYPLAARGEFEVWMQDQYLPVHLPTYLRGQVKTGSISAEDARAIVAALMPKRLKPISPSDSVPILKRAARRRRKQ